MVLMILYYLSYPVNVNFRNFIDNFTDIDDGLHVEDEELLSIVINIISNSKGVVLRSILNMVDDRLGKKAKVLSRNVKPRKSYYGGRIQSVIHRFLAQRIYIEGVKQMSALQKFILEVLDGRRIHDRSVCKFDIFVTILETHLVWWPLCYIFCILSRSISFCSRNQDRDWPQLGAYCAVRQCVLLLRCI